MKKYLAIFYASLAENFYNYKKLQLVAVLVPFRIFIMLIIYSYAFKYLGYNFAGINAKIAVWSIAVYHILLFAQFRGIFKTINEEIKNGNVETQLIKPFHYLLFKIWEHLGKSLLNFSVGLVAGLLLLLMLVGFPENFLFFNFLLASVLIVFGVLVSASLYIFIVLPAFWINDAEPFFWLIDKAIMIFGGSYIPIILLPKTLQAFVNFSPFGAPMFATQMFNPNFAIVWPRLLAAQVFWLGFFTILIYLVYKNVLKKLSINGG